MLNTTSLIQMGYKYYSCGIIYLFTIYLVNNKNNPQYIKNFIKGTTESHDIPCLLKYCLSGWIRLLEQVTRRLYHKKCQQFIIHWLNMLCCFRHTLTLVYFFIEITMFVLEISLKLLLILYTEKYFEESCCDQISHELRHL